MRLIYLIVLTTGLFAQPQNSPHCTLAQQTDLPDSYRDRKDRCEGLYRLKVSGAPVSVVGFGQSLSGLDWKKTKQLDLSWGSPPGQAVRLRALSLEPEIPFRMDSSRPPDGRDFRWTTDILTHVELAGDDLALAAWYEDRTAAGAKVYVPVMVAGRQGTPLEVMIYPGTTFKCTVSLSVEGTQTNLFSEKSQPSKARYPETVPIPVSLPAGLKPGVYRFVASVKTLAGGSSADSVLLRIP